MVWMTWKGIESASAENRIFWENKVNTMAAEKWWEMQIYLIVS